jgi:methoxymalonate biosynthesis acyl carrier protein
MNEQDVASKIKNFLQRYVGEKELEYDEEIFSSGLINSLFAMQLVLFLEKEFKLKVENKDLDLKNFRTLGTIAEFVSSKQIA